MNGIFSMIRLPFRINRVSPLGKVLINHFSEVFFIRPVNSLFYYLGYLLKQYLRRIIFLKLAVIKK